MDTNAYEYQSYTLLRRRMKDRGALRVQVRLSGKKHEKTDGTAAKRLAEKLRVSVTARKEYRLRRAAACVHAGPFALPAPSAEQNNEKSAAGILNRQDAKTPG